MSVRGWHPTPPVSGWFDQALASQEQQLREAVAQRLDALARTARVDPTTAALDAVDGALAGAAERFTRTREWSPVLDVLLDYRLNVMADRDRDRGYRLADHRRRAVTR